MKDPIRDFYFRVYGIYLTDEEYEIARRYAIEDSQGRNK
jgi:hypothetical protein